VRPKTIGQRWGGEGRGGQFLFSRAIEQQGRYKEAQAVRGRKNGQKGRKLHALRESIRSTAEEFGGDSAEGKPLNNDRRRETGEGLKETKTFKSSPIQRPKWTLKIDSPDVSSVRGKGGKSGREEGGGGRAI